MVRTMPVVHNEEIDLYIRTYYSLLRSSEPIRIRSLEESHAAMNSSLHQQAASPEIDVSALTYSALRLPDCIVQTKLMVMGQMADVFWREGYQNVEEWRPVKARARRRKFFFDPQSSSLAAFIASVSDIDDLIPCLTTLQIEWNKMHIKLSARTVGEELLMLPDDLPGLPADMLAPVQDALGFHDDDFAKLLQVWQGRLLVQNLQAAAQREFDIRVHVLGSGLSDYRRSVQCWWIKLAREAPEMQLEQRPLYFISSNAHSMSNLLSGFVGAHRQDILEFVRAENPENLLEEYEQLPTEDNGHLVNFLYYASRPYVGRTNARDSMRLFEEEVGIHRVSEPHCLDVEAQVIDVSRLDAARFDPRLQIFDQQQWEILKQSDALIFNIDYPLGMAAYHIFSQVSTAGGRILGVYILGKAATLNGRVGDVMIPNVVYDEHSRNSFLFRNCFTAQDVAPYLNYGTVFDNQKAVTVRGTILQNRRFMGVFYQEGYTDIEMEAGPYLSSIYEDVFPQRYPINEIVNLFINVPYEIGVIHYASDTPISRRQALLSKSLSYFGVDATYATSVAVLRRILEQEVARQRKGRK
jgi:hypothetical protein